MILLQPERFSAVDVSDLAWTEIDFDGDVARARQCILPKLAG
jgi:choline kinase